MSEKVILRWKTEGLLDEKLLGQATILATMPKYTRVAERIAQVVIGLCLVLLLVMACVTGEWEALLRVVQIVLIAAIYSVFVWGIRKWVVHMSVKAFREQNATGGCPYSVGFGDKGAYVHNIGNGAKAVIAFEHFSRLCQVEKEWVLLTKMKAIVPIYQSQLSENERAELLSFLLEKCPKLKNELKHS